MKAVLGLIVVICLTGISLIFIKRYSAQTPIYTPPPTFSPPPATPTPNPGNNPTPFGNPFGLMFAPKLTANPQPYISLAKQFNVVYYRPLAIGLDQWRGSWPEAQAAKDANLKLVLMVWNQSPKLTSRGVVPTDLSAYKQKVGEILDKFRPEIFVIEGEEDSQLFQGTPDQYAKELEAGCSTAHQRGIKCTNGGLVSGNIAALVSGQTNSRTQIDEELINIYKNSSIDYVNFHWYIADTGLLEKTVNYLREKTGKPVITNEIGQWNEDPGQIAPVLSKLIELKIPIAVWFSADAGKARSLINPDDSLRPNGQAFMDFMTMYK